MNSALYRNRQSHKLSMLEAFVNLLVGFLASLVIAYFILPLWGLEPSLIEAVEIVAVYTIISFVRAYMVRRLFERCF